MLRTGVLLVSASTSPVSIEPARADDGPAILRLLSAAALPVDGVLDRLDTAVVARAGGRLVGCAALEIYRDGALLRSVAVDAAARGQGIGTRVTSAALDMARARGVRVVYLLTTTAEGFFPRFAFEPIDRQHMPASVQASEEFQSACPSTAIVMRKTLTDYFKPSTT